MSRRRIVITGASDGIGRDLAKRLVSDFDIVLCGRDEERLKQVSKECRDAEYYAFDLGNSEARKQAVDAMKQNGKVDVLINNAGVWHKMGQLEEIDDEVITEVINTNLTSQILFTKLLLPEIRQSSRGAIINVISKSGVTAQEGQSVYSASKWGMRGFTDVLRNDLKGEVRVGAVYQSGTNTKLFEKAGEDFATGAFSDPKDIADAVAYMLSRPENMWINEIRIEK